MVLSKNEWLENNRQEEYNGLLNLAYTTLMKNVYEDHGYLWSPYRCISPGRALSPDGDGFRGIWNWDTAFHSVGVSRWNPELAREGLLGYMQFQKENGLFPDVIWEHGGISDAFSKPPVLAWACEIVYKREKNTEFLKKVYPMLVKNERYWVEHRCDRGLFFYDSEDRGSEDYELHARYESGWDNAVRWDDGIVNKWAIDLNCFMVMTYRSLAFIAHELSCFEEEKSWMEKAKKLSVLINEKLWNLEYYADTNRETGKSSRVLSPASFMPLYIGIASKEQAEKMAKIAEENFQCKMPTVSFDNPEYSTDYWRGPTWLNVAYFAAKGLKNYDMEVSEKIRASVLKMCAKDPEHIYENYNSKTGEGLCCNHFSWSCVFIIEFILNFQKKVF